MKTAVHRALWSGVAVVFAGVAFTACGSFGTAPADGGASGTGEGGLPATSDASPVTKPDGGPPAAVRFCKVGHPGAALCADFDDGIVSQIFVVGDPKSAGVEKVSAATATPLENAFFASATSNTSAAWFILPMNLLTGPFRLSVEIETVDIAAGGRVEIMQIADKGGANPMRVWIEGDSVKIGVVGSTAPLASVNRQAGPFKVVLERQGFGVALADEQPITVSLPYPLESVPEIKIGAGFPTTGTAQIRFDDVLVDDLR